MTLPPLTHDRFVAHGEQTIHIMELGGGSPAVLLLSGLGDPASSWFALPFPADTQPYRSGVSTTGQAGLAVTLAQQSRVIAYDRAGIGQSTPPPHDRNWAEIYRELDHVMDGSCLSSPPVLMGHSLGGLIAYTYARRFPQRVAGLILLDPTPPPLMPRPAVNLPERLAPSHFEPEEVAPHSLGAMPLALIAPGRARSSDPDATSSQSQAVLDARYAQRRVQHEQLLVTSTRSQGTWTSSTGHYVHLDHPHEVVTATRWVLSLLGA